MLLLTLPAERGFNEETEEFVNFPEVTLRLEHSLISIHKWEAKWHKSYLDNKHFTIEEQLDYIRCMSLDPNLDLNTIRRLRKEDLIKIREYIADPMTATTIKHRNNRPNNTGQFVTAELIYYWMTEFGIPFECNKWHINQLLALIEICSVKQNPGKKMNRQEAAMMRASANEARRRRLGSRG